MLAPYLSFARAAFQRQFAYRVANWAGLFTNALFLFFRAYALEACFAARDSIGGLSAAHVVTYVTVSQALLMVCPQWGALGLAVSVRTGQVAVDLLRPVDLVGLYLARRLAISGYYAVMRMIPLLGIGAAAGLLWLPANLTLMLPFAASVVMAAWTAAAILLLVELSSFWLESERGVRYLVMGAAMLPSGLILPGDFFPPWAQALFWATPFPYTLYLPSKIWLGQTTGIELVYRLSVQLLWAFALTVACRLTLAAGARRLRVVGG